MFLLLKKLSRNAHVFSRYLNTVERKVTQLYPWREVLFFFKLVGAIDWMSLFFQHSCWNLNPNVMYLGVRHLEADLVMRAMPSQIGLVPKRPQRPSLSLLPCENGQSQGADDHMWAKKKALTRYQVHQHFVLGLPRTSELWEIHVCYFSNYRSWSFHFKLLGQL